MLLRGITQQEWDQIGGERITGRDEAPDFRGVDFLTKSQASKLIDVLKTRGGRRYAAATALLWKR
jgi:hypothetical protein